MNQKDNCNHSDIALDYLASRSSHRWERKRRQEFHIILFTFFLLLFVTGFMIFPEPGVPFVFSPESIEQGYWAMTLFSGILALLFLGSGVRLLMAGTRYARALRLHDRHEGDVYYCGGGEYSPFKRDALPGMDQPVIPVEDMSELSGAVADRLCFCNGATINYCEDEDGFYLIWVEENPGLPMAMRKPASMEGLDWSEFPASVTGKKLRLLFLVKEAELHILDFGEPVVLS